MTSSNTFLDIEDVNTLTDEKEAGDIDSEDQVNMDYYSFLGKN
jgi:hypothetical protein